MYERINSRNENFTKKVHPSLRKLFSNLYTSYQITLRPFPRRDELVNLASSDLTYSYAYRLEVSYANERLKWDIIFNPNNLTGPPDFSFNNDPFEEFIYSCTLLDYIPDWLYWDMKKDDCLELTIKGFLALFKTFQENQLQRVATLIADEYQLLASLQTYKPSDIELFINNNGNTTFLIALQVDISQVPEYVHHIDEICILQNPMQDNVLLSVNYREEGRQLVVDITLSPRLHQFIGYKMLRIRDYNSDTDVHLIDYILEVTKYVQKYIDEEVFRYQFRREFIAAFLVLKGKSVIEYDAFYMKFMSLLCEVGGKYFMVRLELGDHFPDEKAVIKIIPFHKINSKLQLPASTLFDYEDSPEIVPDVMAIHLLEKLKIYIVDQFKLEMPMITESNSLETFFNAENK